LKREALFYLIKNPMSLINPSQHYDYAFAGAGASTTLQLMSLERRGLLQNKSVLIIDPDEKIKNDKTYCFWSNTSDAITNNCEAIISYKWNKIIVNNDVQESISPLAYSHVSGSDVYNELRRIIHTYNITRIFDSVLTIEHTNDVLNINTKATTYQAKLMFDSRPPTYKPLLANESHLAQSFIGYVITTVEEITSQDCVRLMDFEVAQQGYTQFMYVLPFNANTALVELTRFGSDVITPNEAEPVLKEYIQSHFGEYTIVDIEKGCIPMSNAEIDIDEIKNVIPIGARAGAIKSSTGYAFKNMFYQAEQLADNIQHQQKLTTKHNKNRFTFYDRLLLLILKDEAEMGKPIFKTLFQKNKAVNVLHFIEEKTSIVQDLKILSSLPIKPFLKALYFDVNVKLKSIGSPVLLILFTILLIAIQASIPASFDIIQYTVFAIGLFLVGIPHGALDNIVESGDVNNGIKLNFIVKYLLKAGVYFIVWLIHPGTALVLFLLYSAMHFGQADMQEWKANKSRIFESTVWGAIVLSMLLLGHVSETNSVLKNMDVFVIPLSNESGLYATLFLSIVGVSWGLYSRKIPMIMISLTLLLAIYLPLLTAFALYFIGQHSITGWAHLKNSFNSNNITLFKKALPYNLGAWFLFSIVLINMDNSWTSSFFIFVSCISLPHVLAMNKFYKED
jgi:lycopene beta-cyclase